MNKKKASADENDAVAPEFVAEFWTAAERLRGNVDATDYAQLVLGVIFLKYLSDQVGEPHDSRTPRNANAGGRDRTAAGNIRVPDQARWSRLLNNADQPAIGMLLDEAMFATECDNSAMRGLTCVEYARPTLHSHRLAELIGLIDTIGSGINTGQGKTAVARLLFDNVLRRSVRNDGTRQSPAPHCISRTMIEALFPRNGCILDPCCGSGGILVEAARVVIAHGGRISDLTVHGQEWNPPIRRLAIMNLAVHGIKADLGPEAEDSLRHDLHSSLKADYILACPPFNVSCWARDKDDPRWKYGVPPKSNANCAWLQHVIHHLAPSGFASVVLPSNSVSSQFGTQDNIRREIIQADLVDCVMALPGQLFHFTPMPVCLWFLAKDKKDVKFRDRRGQTLLIDGRKLGVMTDRTHRVLTDEDLLNLSRTYRAWRGDGDCAAEYEDVPGFCRSATLEEIQASQCLLTPSRYVGTEKSNEPKDDLSFDERMQRLFIELNGQFLESRRLEKALRSVQEGLGYGE